MRPGRARRNGHAHGPRTILLAEDDPDVRLMFKMVLEARGYRVVEAADGPETVRIAEGEHPDLIMMDLQLPRLNGFAVARFVRQHDRLKGVPIVVVSGHDPAKHRQLAMAAGCNAYLHKPVDFEQLEELLASLLPSR